MKNLIFTAITATALFITACGSNTTTTKPTDSTGVKAASSYTCPMHPEVVSDKPGTCPKCKMDLVAKDGAEGHTGH